MSIANACAADRSHAAEGPAGRPPARARQRWLLPVLIGALALAAPGAMAAAIAEVSRAGDGIGPGDREAVAATSISSATVLDYQIRNTGDQTLVVALPITVNGQVNCATSVVQPGPGSTIAIPAGQSAPLRVTVVPQASDWAFSVAFADDSQRQGPFRWHPFGFATAAAAPVLHVLREIDGASDRFIAQHGSDGEGGTAAGTATVLDYALLNLGTATLTTAGAATVAGTVNCTVTTLIAPATSIISGEGAQLRFLVVPTAAGPWAFTATVASDDAARSPYTWRVAGFAGEQQDVIGPEGVLTRAGERILSGERDAVAGSVVGSDLVLDYEVRNIGDRDLVLSLPLAVADPLNCTAVVTQPGPGDRLAIASGRAATFSITVRPTAAGPWSFSTSHDDRPGSGANAGFFTWTTLGIANATPAARVVAVRDERPGGEVQNELFDGQRLVIGDGETDVVRRGFAIGRANGLEYDLANLGDAVLTTTGAATFSAQTNCTVTQRQLPQEIEPGDRERFRLVVVPTVDAPWSFTVAIATNAVSDGTLVWTVRGNGVVRVPEFGGMVKLSRPGGEFGSDDMAITGSAGDDFVSATQAGVDRVLPHLITNIGDADLVVDLPIVISGQVNCTATVTADLEPTATIPPGGTATFAVTVRPTAAGPWRFGAAFSDRSQISAVVPVRWGQQGIATAAPQPVMLVARQDELLDEDDFVVSGATDTIALAFAAGQANRLDYGIGNLGGATLLLTGPVTVTAPVNCTVTVHQPRTAYAPGETTQDGDEIQFAVVPLAVGAWSFTVSVPTNDPAADPFTWSATGTAATAASPRLDLSGGRAARDLDRLDGGFDFVPGTVGSGRSEDVATIDYTVTNRGGVDLVFDAGAEQPAVSNPVNCQVAVFGVLPDRLGPGESQDIFMQVLPSGPGPWRFELSIASNDTRRPLLTWTVFGTATGTRLLRGDGIISGGRDRIVATTAGEDQVLTYQIANVSPGGDLTVALPIAVSAQVNCTATVGQPGGGATLTIPPEQSRTFTITVRPTAAGPWSFASAFADSSQRPDGGPFTWITAGFATAAPAPVLNVGRDDRGDELTIVDGGADREEFTAATIPSFLNYSISNLGTNTLTLTSPVSTSAQVNCVVTVFQPGQTTFEPGESSGFTVQVTPTSPGPWSFTAAILSDDGPRSPFTWAVSGNAFAAFSDPQAQGIPEIRVVRAGSPDDDESIADGDLDILEATVVSTDRVVTYEISNPGEADLVIRLPIAVDGQINCTTQVTQPGAGSLLTIRPGGQVDLTIAVRPTAAGVWSFVPSCESNALRDGGAPAFWKVSGVATTVTAPVMLVGRDQIGPFADGDTDLRLESVAGVAAPLDYFLFNAGGAALTTAGSVVIGAQTNCAVAVATPPPATLAPGDESLFTLAVTPAAVGAWSFTATLASNDPVRSPITWTVSGSATAVATPVPQMHVFRAGSDTTFTQLPDGGTDTIDGTAAGLRRMLGYFVENTGSAPLGSTAAATIAGQSNCTVTVFEQPLPLVDGFDNGDIEMSVTPIANGPWSFTVSIANSDQPRNPFNWTVSGVAGAPAPNTPPTISDIADQTVAQDASTGALAFTVDDAETAAGALTVSATSDNTELVPDASIVFGGSGGDRTVTVTPAAGLSGSATITLTVEDAQGLTATEAFLVTVVAGNTAPTITAIADQSTDEDTPTAALSFTVNDGETTAAALSVSASSSDQALVSNAVGLLLSGAGATRTLTVVPVADASGTATITLTVSDGLLSSSTSFQVTVLAVNDTPTITAIADQTLERDRASAALAFTIGDVETAVAALSVSATSSDADVVPSGNLQLGGTGAVRTITVTPAAGAIGSAVITVTVVDALDASASSAFTVTVNAAADEVTARFLRTERAFAEGTSGRVVVELAGAAPRDIAIAVAVAAPGGTGAADSTDLIVTSTTVAIRAGQRSGALSFAVRDDGVAESDEDFTLTIPAQPGVVVDAEAGTLTGTIAGQPLASGDEALRIAIDGVVQTGPGPLTGSVGQSIRVLLSDGSGSYRVSSDIAQVAAGPLDAADVDGDEDQDPFQVFVVTPNRAGTGTLVIDATGADRLELAVTVGSLAPAVVAAPVIPPSPGEATLYAAICPGTDDGLARFKAAMAGKDATQAKAFAWDAQSQAYVQFPAEPAGGLTPFHALFVASRLDLGLDFSGTTAPAPFAILLRPGFNFIGLPPISDGAAGAITTHGFLADFTLKSMLGATIADPGAVLGDDVFLWDGVGYAAIGSGPAAVAATISSGQGVWVLNQSLEGETFLLERDAGTAPITKIDAAPRAVRKLGQPPPPPTAASSSGAQPGGGCGNGGAFSALILAVLLLGLRRWG